MSKGFEHRYAFAQCGACEPEPTDEDHLHRLTSAGGRLRILGGCARAVYGRSAGVVGTGSAILGMLAAGPE